MLERFTFFAAMMACTTALADQARPKHDELKKQYSPADLVTIDDAEKEIGRMVNQVNGEGKGGMNEHLIVKKIGQPDRWAPLPENQRSHVTATVDWDSFHDHVDAVYGYKWVGEHCLHVLFGVSRYAEYHTGDDNTRPALKAQMRDEIKTVRCRWDAGALVEPDTKFRGDVLRLSGGVFTGGFNWDTASIDVETRTAKWLKDHL